MTTSEGEGDRLADRAVRAGARRCLEVLGSIAPDVGDERTQQHLDAALEACAERLRDVADPRRRRGVS